MLLWGGLSVLLMALARALVALTTRVTLVTVVIVVLIIAALVTLAVAIKVLTATLVTLVVALIVALGVTLIAGDVLLTILVGLTVLLFKPRVQNAVIVVGMLEIVFRENAVARRAGIARHGEELFHQLLRVAAHPAVVVAAVEIRVAATAATAAATSAWTRFAAVAATLTVFHIIVRFVHQNTSTFLNSEINSPSSLGRDVRP